MTEAKPGSEDQSQVREIEVGQWFHPLKPYDTIPYVSSSSKNYQAKALNFVTEGCGWHLIFDCDQQEYQRFEDGSDIGDKKILVVSPDPDKETVITPAEIVEYQKKLESRLMLLIVGQGSGEEWRNNPPQFNIHFLLPSGNFLLRRLRELERWPERDPDADFNAILIPEVPSIIEKLKISIQRA
jgi:hypothetical protein